MKNVIIVFLSSMLKTLAAAVAIGGIAFLAGESFIIYGTAGFVGQYIVFYLYNSFLQYKAAKTIKENQLKELELLAKVTFTVNCAACKNANQVVINASTDNYFECEHCKAKNAVYISTEAALVTTPVATAKPII
jgi:hypothetical protein